MEIQQPVKDAQQSIEALWLLIGTTNNWPVKRELHRLTASVSALEKALAAVSDKKPEWGLESSAETDVREDMGRLFMSLSSLGQCSGINALIRLSDNFNKLLAERDAALLKLEISNSTVHCPAESALENQA